MIPAKYTLIVFDLDDTILDTSKELLHIANTPQFFERIQLNLPTIEGALDNLKYLSTRYILVLLTQGKPEVQRQKIKSLAISNFFDKIYICNSDQGESKKAYFQQILSDYSLPAEKCLSIGNRRSTDIRLAKQLGFKTCLHAYGEHTKEPAEIAEDNPDFEFLNHKELIKLCQL